MRKAAISRLATVVISHTSSSELLDNRVRLVARHRLILKIVMLIDLLK